MSLKNWSTTPASNNSAPPNGAPEAMTLLSDVNDIMRQMMADVRTLAAADVIASATTCDLGTKDATLLNITGTITITGFGTVSAGIYKYATFMDSMTLTHNATSLILFGANITTVIGDSALFRSLGSGNWRCLAYQPVGGYAQPASPTFTGTPTAPTAAVGTNTTQLATTAHVLAERTATATLTNKTLTSPAITIEAVIAPTLLNSWVDYGGAWTTAGYWKDAYGVVHIHGTVKNGLASDAFVLPVGYRPPAAMRFVVDANTALGIAQILSTGEFAILGASTAFTSFNGISFRTT